jgi:hypothetical protein
LLTRVAVLAAGALLLAGCWTGAPFYGNADTHPLLTSGYQIVYPNLDRKGQSVRVTIQSDGFTPLPEGAPVNIGWTVELGSGRHHPYSSFYSSIQAEGEGKLPVGAMRIASCECRFPDRASLEAALPRAGR